MRVKVFRLTGQFIVCAQHLEGGSARILSSPGNPRDIIRDLTPAQYRKYITAAGYDAYDPT